MEIRWTDERVELLKKLHADGFSASQIAAELGGVTRNAVCGKVDRLGIKRTGAPRSGIRRAPQRTLGSYIAGKVKRKDDKPTLEELFGLTCEQIKDLPPDQSDSMVSVLDAQEHHCRWPIGDPSSPEFMYCGDNKIPGRPYCLRHCCVAYMHARSRRPFIPMRKAAA